MGKIKPLEQVIADAKKKHLERNYNYSLIDENTYVGVKTIVPIICDKHGVFTQRMGHHLEGQICPYCSREIAAKKKSKKQIGKPQAKALNVHGVGVNDYNGTVVNNGKVLKSYQVWNCMLNRCYNKKHHIKHPSYANCTVCGEWLYFSNFKEWFDENYVEGYHLDKDILIKGNRIYSQETCCFVPREINNIIENAKAMRGKTPMGVLERCGRYLSYVRVNGKRIYLGTFDTIEQAFEIMKERKEMYIKDLAKKYYNDGKIARNVYDALMNYKIEITD